MSDKKWGLNRLKQLSFRSKMALATVAVCAATVAIACVAFTINELLTYQARFEQEQTSLSEVLAANTSAAVLFGDDSSASEVLSATRLTPQVDAAYVLTTDGEIFAFYSNNEQLTASQEVIIEDHTGIEFRSDIIIDDEIIGELVLLTNQSELRQTITRYAMIALVVFLGSTLFAIMLARWEAQAMYNPMLQLRETIQSIRETRDYSARVQTSPDKDFGRLIDSFNAMLAEIESRDERLEKLVDDLMSARDSAQSANTAKSQFLANMSHELRTPLNAIINYSEMVAEDLEEHDDSEDVIADVNKIQKAGLHLLNLINGILDLSKIEAGKMEVESHKFDITTLIREASDTVRPAAAHNNNELVVNVEDNLGEAITDSVKMRQCILNLLSNACKFTENGVIELNVSTTIKNDNQDHLKLEITDSGIGMDQSQVARLFEAFVQADASTTRQYGGTGLGLAITRRLTEIMGGEISVHSEVGVGSTFTIIIPRHHPSSQSSTDNQEEVIETPSRKLTTSDRTALIVDDDPAARELMERIATRLSYETVTAVDGKEAINLALEIDPSVIILDLHMPVMDGWTLLEQLRSDTILSRIPTIVVSVDDDSKRCYKLGAEDYFTKPVNRIELERALLSYTKVVGGKVLVIEDNEDAADMLVRAGSNVGYQVIVATSAEDAMKTLEENEVLGIILDLGLPIMDGFDFLKNLRDSNKWKDMPVIVFSAQELSEEDLSTIQENAQGYHMKGAVSPRSVVSDLMSHSATEPALLEDIEKEVG